MSDGAKRVLALAALLRQKAFALSALAGQLAGAADGLSLLAGTLLRRLLVVVPQLHLAEDTFALKLLLERPEGLINIVVADQYLHAISSLRAKKLTPARQIELRKWV